MIQDVMNPALLRFLIAAGWGRWKKLRVFHLATTLGLAVGVVLLLLLLSLPGAIQTKVSRLETRIPAPVPRNIRHESGGAEFLSFFYIERWHGRKIEILAVDVSHVPVRIPGSSALTKSGDVIVSYGLGHELSNSNQYKSLMTHLGGSEVKAILKSKMDAEPGEYYAYVGVDQSALLGMCKCSAEQNGLSSFENQSERSDSHLSYGYVLLIAFATALLTGVLLNSLTLALSLLFEKERRLIGEMNLMGAAHWMSVLIFLVGLTIDIAMSLVLGAFAVRPIGAFLGKAPPSGYKLPIETLGHASSSIILTAFLAIVLALFLSLRKALEGIESNTALNEIRSGNSKSESRAIQFGSIGGLLLVSVWFLGGIADSQTASVSLVLMTGIVCTSIGLSRSTGIAQRIFSSIISKREGASTVYLRALLRANRRDTGTIGVLVGLVIAAGIVTSFGTLARGGDSFTMGRSYEALKLSTAVIVGTSEEETRVIERLSDGNSVVMKLVVGVDSLGRQQRFLLGNCDRLKKFVVKSNSFECNDGAPVLINQKEFVKAAGTTPQEPPAENSVLQGLSIDGKNIGTIKIGEYAKGEIDLPGDIWLSGAFVLVDPREVDLQVDSRSQRWTYVSTEVIGVEELRDALAPSVRSDVRTVKELSMSGDRTQMKFFKDSSLWFGVLLALLGGISLGLGIIAEIGIIRRNILAASLVGAPRKIIFKAIIALGVVRVSGVLLFASVAATIAGLGYSRLTSAQEYGLEGPLFGFHWWLIAAVSLIAIFSTFLVRSAVVLTASRNLDLTVLQ